MATVEREFGSYRATVASELWYRALQNGLRVRSPAREQRDDISKKIISVTASGLGAAQHQPKKISKSDQAQIEYWRSLASQCSTALTTTTPHPDTSGADALPSLVPSAGANRWDTAIPTTPWDTASQAALMQQAYADAYNSASRQLQGSNQVSATTQPFDSPS